MQTLLKDSRGHWGKEIPLDTAVGCARNVKKNEAVVKFIPWELSQEAKCWKTKVSGARCSEDEA